MGAIITPGRFVRRNGRLHLTNQMSDLADMTVTKVLLETISTGFVDGIEDTGNNRIQPGVPGLYLIVGSIGWIGVQPDKPYRGYLMLNDSATMIGIDDKHSRLAMSLTNVIVATKRLIWSDTISLYAWHNDGTGNADVSANTEKTFLEAHRIG